jgi:hypothetical protein
MGVKKAKQTEAEKITAAMGLYKTKEANAYMDKINPELEKFADTDFTSAIKNRNQADVFQGTAANSNVNYSNALSSMPNIDIGNILGTQNLDALRKGSTLSTQASSDIISRQLNKEGDATNIFSNIGIRDTNNSIMAAANTNALRDQAIAGGIEVVGSGTSKYLDRKRKGGSLFKTNVNYDKQRLGVLDSTNTPIGEDLRFNWKRFVK